MQACAGEIYSHICLRGDWAVTEFFKPVGPNRKAENKWLECQAWTEKSMPGYTDMTDRAAGLLPAPGARPAWGEGGEGGRGLTPASLSLSSMQEVFVPLV